MSGDTANVLAAIGLYAACVVAMMAHPPFRRRALAKMATWLNAIRYAAVEMPLRAVAGRWRPDHARIAELERSELP
ncbi:hypothetical protein [Actinomadura sp. GTD37]|uniref:hypothetical protein n=1 Tax=Actinomadura sp. GTD37 TaxID=1778030 RepID=UPI0035C0B2A9